MTTEKRYRRYEDWTQDEVQQIKENMQNPPGGPTTREPADWTSTPQRLFFTLMASGWFFTKTSLGAAHGLKCWVQLESDDLVHFTKLVSCATGYRTRQPRCLLGSAMQFDNKLFLFYTGNVRDENWVRHLYQIGAFVRQL